MRWIYLAVIILFAAATIIFALQNFEIVTMSFLGFNARVPLAAAGRRAPTCWARRAGGGSLFCAAASILRRVPKASWSWSDCRSSFRLRPEDDEGRDGARPDRSGGSRFGTAHPAWGFLAPTALSPRLRDAGCL